MKQKTGMILAALGIMALLITFIAAAVSNTSLMIITSPMALILAPAGIALFFEETINV